MNEQLNLWTSQVDKDDLAARDLVYGSSNCSKGLVFVQRKVATDLATIWNALSESKTWGKFKAMVGPRIYQGILDRGQFDGCYSLASFQFEHPDLPEEESARAYRDLRVGGRLPLDEDPFEMYSINGVADGDWPIWPEQLMIAWNPPEILHEYGRSESSALNGPFATLDESREEEIVAAFKRRGYQCVRDDELIAHCSV